MHGVGCSWYAPPTHRERSARFERELFFPPLFRSFPLTHTHTSSTLTNGCVKDTDSTLVQLLFLNERVVRDCCIIVALYNRATLDKLQCRERRRNARNEIKKWQQNIFVFSIESNKIEIIVSCHRGGTTFVYATLYSSVVIFFEWRVCPPNE